MDGTIIENLDSPEQKTSDSELDKRPWLMDALLFIGNSMAAITHIQEKIQYLLADIELGSELSNEEMTEKIDEIANLRTLKDEIYAGYNIIMTHIMNLPEAKKEYRCLLKHTATNLVLAMELEDASNAPAMSKATKKAFNSFAGAVSLALGIEFKSCIRCIYDGLKSISDEHKV